jgi:hypothetical protein
MKIRRSGAVATECSLAGVLTPVGTAELDRLGDEIALLAAHLDAATARLLDLIREFDALGGWSNGFPSCAAWLTWRVGLGAGAAREHVRVARPSARCPYWPRPSPAASCPMPRSGR